MIFFRSETAQVEYSAFVQPDKYVTLRNYCVELDDQSILSLWTLEEDRHRTAGEGGLSDGSGPPSEREFIRDPGIISSVLTD